MIKKSKHHYPTTQTFYMQTLTQLQLTQTKKIVLPKATTSINLTNETSGSQTERSRKSSQVEEFLAYSRTKKPKVVATHINSIESTTLVKSS